MHTKLSIELLPENVIEKIAAGEVVERPASVIKELIENSIDADATNITITVENAGLSLIKVTDNGIGMSKEDLLKCTLRHATSKIRGVNDLFSIQTMGFRGEALGSIAAVSRMTVVSSPTDDGLGFRIDNEGGKIGEIVPENHPRGTTVIVRDLFYNVPARKKFMKSHKGEQLAIIRMLEQFVIPFTQIHFTLYIDGRQIFDLPPVETHLERIASVGGRELASSLIRCDSKRQNIEATIYVSSPERLQQKPRFQCLYVNKRRINNDSVLFSVREAFSQFIGHNNRPSFFCLLTIDPSHIDVNVHPTKQLIKFDNENLIYSFIYATVKSGLQQKMVSSKELKEGYNSKSISVSQEISSTSSLSLFPDEKKEIFSVKEKDNFQDIETSKEEEKTSVKESQIYLFPAGTKIENLIDLERENKVQLKDESQEKMWDLIPCYQIHGMFILAPIKNGILLIDQHAAHERILFEQAMKNSTEIRKTSQQLLFPIVVELTPAEKSVIISGKEYFESFGFEIEDFGRNTVSISAIPAFIKSSSVESVIRDMIRYLLEDRRVEDFSEPHKRFSAAFACGAAIKAGCKLSQEEMNSLINNLFATENPYICPHGRPTVVRISLDELSRRFLR
ncbi:MAG: DNA mismatch repair endonuclease MutL [Chitinispirillaceae bacterium]|nr:DNA mismatch repair endonuclease MutL [Chitinispirillaceae bacterium]